MKVFELKAKFPAEPPQEPEWLSFYVVAEIADQAIAQLQSQGGYDIKIIRQLTDEEALRFRYLRSALL